MFILFIAIIVLIVIGEISLVNDSKHSEKTRIRNIHRIVMNEKGFKFWTGFHRLGELSYFLIILVICIIIGNISEQIINLIYSHMVILTFDEIIKSTISWSILGIWVSKSSWKSNEISYDNYIKQHNKI